MASLTIRLDERLENDLNSLAARKHRSKSDLAREILRQQLTIEKFRGLRAQAIPYAEQAGFLTDEDVFQEIS